jgi:2-iminoacetate synthase
LRREVEALLAMGYRSIELVSSQDPELYVHSDSFDLGDQRFRLDGAARYFEILRDALAGRGGGMITSNIPPVDTDSFRRLRQAGLDCYLVWLETFDPAQYRRLHSTKGPKGNQAFRLDSFERARDAGIEHVAGGFLKGLAPWYHEEVVLYLFDRYLKQRFGRGFSVIGTPRVKGRFLRSGAIRQYTMSDGEYETNIALDRLLFDGILWLQTRESFEMNRHLIETFGGGVILTLTSSTAPGGYATEVEASPQFPVFKQELEDSVRLLEAGGFRVRFDWGCRDLEACQRRVA